MIQNLLPGSSWYVRQMSRRDLILWIQLNSYGFNCSMLAAASRNPISTEVKSLGTWGPWAASHKAMACKQTCSNDPRLDRRCKEKCSWLRQKQEPRYIIDVVGKHWEILICWSQVIPMLRRKAMQQDVVKQCNSCLNMCWPCWLLTNTKPVKIVMMGALPQPALQIFAARSTLSNLPAIWTRRSHPKLGCITCQWKLLLNSNECQFCTSQKNMLLLDTKDKNFWHIRHQLLFL
jgi:hypothetical protein